MSAIHINNQNFRNEVLPGFYAQKLFADGLTDGSKDGGSCFKVDHCCRPGSMADDLQAGAAAIKIYSRSSGSDSPQGCFRKFSRVFAHDLQYNTVFSGQKRSKELFQFPDFRHGFRHPEKWCYPHRRKLQSGADFHDRRPHDAFHRGGQMFVIFQKISHNEF